MGMDLRDELVFPTLRILREREKPLIFSAGCGQAGLPLALSSCPK
jgi:hypothetical protein